MEAKQRRLAERLARVDRAVRLGEAERVQVMCEFAESYSVDCDAVIEVLVERRVQVGASGTPKVSEFVMLELAGLLGCSPIAAGHRLAAALNLKHRHPSLFGAVGRGEIELERALKAASRCSDLDPDLADRVTRRWLPRQQALNWGAAFSLLDKLVIEADRALAAERERVARESRSVYVWGLHEGCLNVTGRVDVLDGIHLDHSVQRMAEVLASQYPELTLQQLRAKALGVLAHPAHALALLQAAAQPSLIDQPATPDVPDQLLGEPDSSTASTPRTGQPADSWFQESGAHSPVSRGAGQQSPRIPLSSARRPAGDAQPPDSLGSSVDWPAGGPVRVGSPPGGPDSSNGSGSPPDAWHSGDPSSGAPEGDWPRDRDESLERGTADQGTALPGEPGRGGVRESKSAAQGIAPPGEPGHDEVHGSEVASQGSAVPGVFDREGFFRPQVGVQGTALPGEACPEQLAHSEVDSQQGRAHGPWVGGLSDAAVAGQRVVLPPEPWSSGLIGPEVTVPSTAELAASSPELAVPQALGRGTAGPAELGFEGLPEPADPADRERHDPHWVPGHLCGTITGPIERLRPKVGIAVHLHADSMGRLSGAARVERAGWITRELLADLLGDVSVTVQPVIDLGHQPAEDRYLVSSRLRRAMELAMPTEMFPFSNRRSQGLDADHSEPYQPGEPGQTRLGNLVPLSRRVHRAKTLGAWTSEQTAPDVIVWTSPLDFRYEVGPGGTRRLD